jgi:DNA-binding NtrC family response regulator
MKPSVLIVDDEKSLLSALKMTLEGKYTVHTAETGARALHLVQTERPDLILLDIGLPDTSGMSLLEEIRNGDPKASVIMITAVEETRTVVKALKLGAYDYLVKPIDAQELRTCVQNALENRQLKDKIRRIQRTNVERYKFEFIGQSPRVQAVVETARKAARSSDTPVLIIGESGTGKGVLARTIHYGYSDLPGPFVTVNCTAIAPELFESELFGYERGAFTGARSEGKMGRFEESSEGTLFLDEIGSMSLVMQSKLLGVLEDRVYYRVGGTRPLQVSSRIVAATNVDLEHAVQKGQFRSDLFFRLNVIKLDMPPLRERADDIMPLTRHFMATYNQKFGKRFSCVSAGAERIITGYSWPGNVRELRNTMERIVLLESGTEIIPEHLAFLPTMPEPVTACLPFEDFSGGLPKYEEAIKSLILEALRQTGGNVVEASRLLNMPIHKMRYRIKKYGLRNDPRVEENGDN